jgi:hypothetical protein
MGHRALATFVLLVAGALPWLTLAPGGGVFAVMTQVLTLVAAFHGAGQLVVRLTRRPPSSPLLAIQIGIATLIAVSGVAILLGFDHYAFQVGLITSCAGLHCVLLVIDVRHYRTALENALAGDRLWCVPACLLLAIAFVQILGAAGDVGAWPFDDDGHVLAQVQRLRDTGWLGDVVGYARRSQLGGQVALTALATVPGDVHLARIMEALASVLAIGLALAQLGVRDRAGALLGTLLVIGASALPYVAPDLATCWIAVGLILALHAMLASTPAEHLVPIALTSGALIALRTELAPIAVVALFAGRERRRRDHMALATLLGGALVVIAPYLLERVLADRSGSELLVDHRLAWSRTLLVLAGACVVTAPLVLLTRRNARLRWFGLATALTLVGIASELTGNRPYALRFLWPLAFAGAVLLAIELVRTRRSTTAMVAVGLAVAALMYAGLTATGRRKWPRRYLDLVDNVEYLQTHGRSAPITASYEDLLQAVPPGSRVGVWVTRPERLNYAAYDLVDLRTPRTDFTKLTRLARAAKIEFLLLEGADKEPTNRVLARRDGVLLIDMR